MFFFTGTLGEDRAINAVHHGAADYVLKDHVKRLPTAVRRALRESAERRQRQQAERRVRELVDLLDKALDAIVVCDLADLVTFWNRGAERLSGWTAAEALGRPIDELFGPESRAKIIAARAELEARGEWRGELYLRHRQGDPFVVEFIASIIRDDQGRPTARLSIVTDITERKKLEDRFLRTQRLESVGMLAAGIAHDLNNVLAPILMGAPMLREHLSDPALSSSSRCSKKAPNAAPASSARS